MMSSKNKSKRWVQEVAYRIGLLRHANGLSQKDVAKATGLSTAAVSRLENPTAGCGMSLEMISDVAAALGVPPSVVLGDRDVFLDILRSSVEDKLKLDDISHEMAPPPSLRLPKADEGD